MNFKPTDDKACEGARQLSAEHVRRVVNNHLWAYNERAVMVGNAFSIVDETGNACRTLWRYSANWSFMGPFRLWVPQSVGSFNIANGGRPSVRLLINARSNGGNGFIRLGAINAALGFPTEYEMDAATDGGTPMTEGQFTVLESDSSTTEFNAVVKLQVHPGDNTWWLAFKTDADADVAPVTLNDAFRSFTAESGLYYQATHPSILSSDISAPTSAPFQYVDVAQSSADMAAGEFRRYTIAQIVDDLTKSGDGQRLCWEATASEWRALIDATTTAVVAPESSPVVARVGACVRCYIDGISVDGSGLYELADRQYGAPFRYLQLASGALTATPVREMYSAHRGRLPIVRMIPDLEHKLPEANSPGRGVPGLWRQFEVPALYSFGLQIVTVGLQVDPLDVPLNDTLDLPDTMAGTVRAYEMTLAFCVADTRTNIPAPAYLQWRGFLGDIDLNETTGATVETVSQPLPIDSRLRRQLLWCFGRTSGSGVPYGTEGLCTGNDVGSWQIVTVRVTEPAGFNDETLKFAGIQVRGTDRPGGSARSTPRRIITVAPLHVRIIEVPV